MNVINKKVLGILGGIAIIILVGFASIVYISGQNYGAPQSIQHLSCTMHGKQMIENCGPLVDENGEGYMSCSGWLCVEDESEMPDLKPVIYLYPEEKTGVKVQLDYKGKIFADYPAYDPDIQGWKVTAYPDGKVINHDDNQEYSYLFWEGYPAEKINWDLSTGFVVKGSDTREFLQEKLAEIGLTPKEYNEFVVYWYPKMQDNKYNLIHFAGTQYTDTAELTIDPQPDAMLRVFMVYKPLEGYQEVIPQEFEHFERKGFTVVEWGGTEIK